MQVILLKDVPKLGRRGEVKDVSSGHAMNLLLPKGLAQIATPQAIAAAKNRQKHAFDAQQHQAAEMAARIVKADGARFEIQAKADKMGHLYQKIDAQRIAKSIGVPLTSVSLEQPLREVGEHKVALQFEKVKATATVAIVAE